VFKLVIKKCAELKIYFPLYINIHFNLNTLKLLKIGQLSTYTAVLACTYLQWFRARHCFEECLYYSESGLNKTLSAE